MNTTPPPDLDISVLIELDAAGRCLTALRSLAKQSLPRERFEVIGVCAGGVTLPEAVRTQADWLLADPRGQAGALHLGFNRAARLATGRIVVRCDASADFPPGFLDCLVASFAAEGGTARQPVVTLQGGGAQDAKLALALHRQDVQLVLAAGRSDMPLEDAAWLLVESGAQHLRLDAGGPAATASALDWRDIPVFIVNRNRHEAMVRLIDWLRAGGTRKIVILDNASTYPPLLQYYDALPDGVNVLRLPQNHGPYVLWQQRVHEVLDTPYVLTDSDIVPADSCPADLVGRLYETLRRYPDASKVGPALRIDNLPDGYADADTVRKWESQFWEHPVAPGLFAAPIDTTFALYPPKADFSIDDRALRLGRPYVVEHTPWYAVEGQLSDEEQYYRSHASKTFSNWSVRGKQSSTYLSERVQRFDQRAKVLNIDAAGERIPGWLNFGHEVQLDAQGRLPLADSMVDGIRLNDALHGVPEIAPLFAELRRAARMGAKLQLRMAVAAGEDWQRQRWAQQLPAAAAQAGWELQELRLVTDRESVAQRLRQQGGGTPPVQAVVVTMMALPHGSATPARLPVPVLIGDDRLAPHFVPARRDGGVRGAAMHAAQARQEAGQTLPAALAA
ncbi:MAG: glycosyltransferase family 2 protein [Piscinibacter sp.]|uniref:glycosyltransferase family 2 protein n=1 Tax=Piscinibacter sp. TaxID=1903157 RepID=UPI003D0DF3F2